MNLQVASNATGLFPSPRGPSLGTLGEGNKAGAKEASTNYARKWHEAGSKRVESRLESGTNQTVKWYEPGSKKERTRLEPARKTLQFVSFRLEAGHAKCLEPRQDRRIDVTQMTGNSVREACNKAVK